MKYYFRAIGDESLKPYLSTDCDITTVQLLPTDDFFILGWRIFFILGGCSSQELWPMAQL